MTNTQHILHRTLDIGIGVFPWFNIFIDVWAMFHLALIFTIVGITRSYLWSKYVFKYGENR